MMFLALKGDTQIEMNVEKLQRPTAAPQRERLYSALYKDGVATVLELTSEIGVQKDENTSRRPVVEEGPNTPN
eukprot:2121476-Pyramimonas_sp.AAC.1